MAEILIKAIDYVHPDPNVDLRGAYKQGMPVVVMEDGHAWGTEERLPKFWLLKIPTISASTVMKYIEPEVSGSEGEIYRRRQWQVIANELPQAALNILNSTGVMTIKAGSYDGPFNYTWAQVRNYFKDLKNNIRESSSL